MPSKQRQCLVASKKHVCVAHVCCSLCSLRDSGCRDRTHLCS